jgi:spermidine synthase
MLMTRESLEFYSARLGRVFWATTLGVGIGALVTVIGSSEAKGNVIHRSRNFYGVLSVLERDKDKPRDYHRLLRHGRTIHGIQYMLSEKQDTPVTYYPNDSGIGRALRAALLGEPKHIGVIGMGAGVVAAYGRKGDRVRFYEIDPDVISAADNYFYFTKNSKSEIDVVLGDARLSMEREPAQEFDLFIIDAFSSAAIPTHLLTKEAFEVYLRHLKPGGVFVLHITNRYIDLRPVVARLARKFGLEVRAVKVKARPDELVVDSIWVIMTSNSEFFDKSEFADIKTVELPMGELWTDDYSNVFGLLKW